MSSALKIPTPPASNKLTVEDYENLADDGKRYELIEGVLVSTPAPVTRHQRVSRRLHFVLYQALELTGRGEVFNAPTDVVFANDTVLQPDILYVPQERLDIIGERNIVGPPELVVELLSPTTRRRDVITKSKLYARFGVPSLWLVDPDIDRIELFELAGHAYELILQANAPDLVRPARFEGVTLALADLFA